MDITQVIPKDAIPSIDEPSFEDHFAGDTDDRVVVPVVEGESARAYPLRILNFHEIANDRIGAVPVAVTWCPLCGTVAVFDRRVDGRTLTFGVSGKLADDNLVMYDRETGSEWKQSLGECIDGELSGERLTVLSAIETTWAQYEALVEEQCVLSETDMESEAASSSDSPARIDYDRNPYERYFSSPGFGLAAHRNQAEERTWDRKDLEPKSRVVGLGVGTDAVGVPRPWVRDRDNVVSVTAGDHDAVVFATGSGTYAYRDPGFTFAHASGERFEGDDTTWHAVAGTSEDGRTLERLPSKWEFAFTWQDDHGPDRFAPR